MAPCLVLQSLAIASVRSQWLRWVDAVRLNRGPEDRGPRTKLVGNLGNTREAWFSVTPKPSNILNLLEVSSTNNINSTKSAILEGLCHCVYMLTTLWFHLFMWMFLIFFVPPKWRDSTGLGSQHSFSRLGLSLMIRWVFSQAQPGPFLNTWTSAGPSVLWLLWLLPTWNSLKSAAWVLRNLRTVKQLCLFQVTHEPHFKSLFRFPRMRRKGSDKLKIERDCSGWVKKCQRRFALCLC